MTRGERWTMQIATLLVAGTGSVYAVMRYLMRPVDEWAVVNHPWQPLVQHLHVLTAPLLVFACGLIWHRHVVGRWRGGQPQGRRSGPGLLATLVPMVASGYLLQTTITASWRQVWVVVHVATSLAWIAFFVAHQVRAWFAGGSGPGLEGGMPYRDER